MRRMLMGLVVMAMLVTPGCVANGGGGGASDEQLAGSIKAASMLAGTFGIQQALAGETPEKVAEITENTKLAVKIIRENILPVFSGAGSADVLRSAVETALEQLTSKLKPTVVAAIQLALELVSSQVPLPDNPAEKLSPRLKMAVAALFDGLAAGLDMGLIGSREIRPPQLKWSKK